MSRVSDEVVRGIDHRARDAEAAEGPNEVGVAHHARHSLGRRRKTYHAGRLDDLVALRVDHAVGVREIGEQAPPGRGPEGLREA